MSRVYAGIGARTAPNKILELMISIGRYYAQQDYFVRTGAAQGSDQAFMLGAMNKSIVYLPWYSYEHSMVDHCGSRIGCNMPTAEAIVLASKHHPAWGNCTDQVCQLHGRNAHIILGNQLDNPVEFVVYYTNDGLVSGGTGMGIRIAQSLKIPVYNLYDESVRVTFEKMIRDSI